MKYFKILHDTPYDPALAVIGKRVNLRRCEVLALWVTLLDHASKNNPRGAIDRFDLEQAAIMLELEKTQIESAIASFRDKKFITQNRISHWNKIQSPSTARVRLHRQRKKTVRQEISHPDSAAVIAERRQNLQTSRLESLRQRGKEIHP